ncbi:Phosphoadenosine phosphosulfate reductase [Ewingella americana]|uniref:Phosphoadenosine phosphosulfate reductase n=1 Tax=Ewingella americana TaxID=41202 RepID=A0A377NGX7_9GAMM|nr:Phosphoadenosine phosphosulfate reductase [Ewingella americana]
MSLLTLAELNEMPKSGQALALAETNAQLEKLSAQDRVIWALENLPGEFALSSSFGIQAAVCLHLVTRQQADIPVILTDTGYLFPETYQFIDQLTEQLKLNLQVFRAAESPGVARSALWQAVGAGRRRH